jgi:hypothetical protein
MAVVFLIPVAIPCLEGMGYCQSSLRDEREAG